MPALIDLSSSLFKRHRLTFYFNLFSFNLSTTSLLGLAGGDSYRLEVHRRMSNKAETIKPSFLARPSGCTTTIRGMGCPCAHALPLEEPNRSPLASNKTTNEREMKRAWRIRTPRMHREREKLFFPKVRQSCHTKSNTRAR